MAVERDPIQVKGPENLNLRLASLAFTTDNSPQDPDNSVPIQGLVEFGNVWLSLPSGREFLLGFYETFLEILPSKGCTFETNASLERQANMEAGGPARPWLKEIGIKVSPAEGSGELTVKRDPGAPPASGVKPWIVHIRPSGYKLGDRETGNPDDPSHMLLGRILEGGWGKIVPKSNYRQFGVAIKLLAPEGGLKVVFKDKMITDRLPGRRAKQRNAAFETLKQQVAEWAVESELSSKRHPDGFDAGHRELVLSHASVLVDLDALTPAAALAGPERKASPESGAAA